MYSEDEGLVGEFACERQPSVSCSTEEAPAALSSAARGYDEYDCERRACFGPTNQA